MKNSISNHFTIEIEQEEYGRWIAEILEIPGILVYGSTYSYFQVDKPHFDM